MNRRRQLMEPYKIKGVDVLLGEPEISDAASNEIPLASIVLPSYQQPRRYFDSQSMAHLIESVRQHGILQPLLVRPLSDNQYELVAGERRFRAAQAVALETVPAIVKDLSTDDALQIALLENLQREDLQPVEETEGILHLLSLKLKTTPDAVVSLFSKAAHPDRESVDNVIHSNEWQVVLDVFGALGRFTPESFRTNRLPLLKLPSDVLDALRQGQIEYTKARAIARVKDDANRQELLAAAIADNLSLSAIRDRIKSLKPAPTPSLRTRFKEISSQMLKLPKDDWDDPKKAKKIAKLLEQLEGLVSPPNG